jgi:CheY-like chemotaxis protein
LQAAAAQIRQAVPEELGRGRIVNKVEYLRANYGRMAASHPNCNLLTNRPKVARLPSPQSGRFCIMARILLVDDDRAIRTTVELLLRRGGHEVVAVADGRDGLAKIQAGTFDLLIVDIFMPGMDGLETTQAVHRQRPELPIIVMSGLIFRSASTPAPDFLAMATKLGAVKSLRKPFRPHELVSAVEECLGTKATNLNTFQQ